MQFTTFLFIMVCGKKKKFTQRRKQHLVGIWNSFARKLLMDLTEMELEIGLWFN